MRAAAATAAVNACQDEDHEEDDNADGDADERLGPDHVADLEVDGASVGAVIVVEPQDVGVAVLFPYVLDPEGGDVAVLLVVLGQVDVAIAHRGFTDLRPEDELRTGP